MDRRRMTSLIMLFGVFALCFLVLPKKSEAQTAQGEDNFSVATQQSSCPVAALNNVPAIALAEVGKSFSNDMTPYNDYKGVPWCSYFASWVLRQAGYSLQPIDNARQLLEWFASEHKNKPDHYYVFHNPTNWKSDGYEYNNLLPGDIVVWKSQDDRHGHAGIIVYVDPCARIVKTVEGNVAGNSVKEYEYNYNTILNRDSMRYNLYGFGRP